MKKILCAVLTVIMLMTVLPVLAEETSEAAAEQPAAEQTAEVKETQETQAAADEAALAALDNQKLDVAYTLALNAITAEDYATAKEYINICFAYCDRQSSCAAV